MPGAAEVRGPDDTSGATTRPGLDVRECASLRSWVTLGPDHPHPSPVYPPVSSKHYQCPHRSCVTSGASSSCAFGRSNPRPTRIPHRRERLQMRQAGYQDHALSYQQIQQRDRRFHSIAARCPFLRRSRRCSMSSIGKSTESSHWLGAPGRNLLRRHARSARRTGERPTCHGHSPQSPCRQLE